MKKTQPQIELEEFWVDLITNSKVTVENINELGEKLGKVMTRFEQLIREARESRDNWKAKYMELKNETKPNTTR